MWSILAWILLAVAIVGGAELYVHKRVEAGKLEVRNKQLERDLNEEQNVGKQKQQVIDHADELSKKRLAELKESNAKIANLEAKLNARAKSDPVLAKWLSDPVPAYVRQLRRDTFGGTPEISLVRGADAKPAANPGPTPDRRDERPVASGSGLVAPSAPVVQPGQIGRTLDTPVPEPAAQSIIDRINNLKKGLKP